MPTLTYQAEISLGMRKEPEEIEEHGNISWPGLISMLAERLIAISDSEPS